MRKNCEALDVAGQVARHPSPGPIVAQALTHAVECSEGQQFGAFIDHLKEGLKGAPRPKFSKTNSDGRKIDDLRELVEAWSVRGDPLRPCDRVRVRRLKPDGKYKYAGLLSPDEAHIEVLANRFGGGDYRCELLDVDGKYCAFLDQAVSESCQRSPDFD